MISPYHRFLFFVFIPISKYLFYSFCTLFSFLFSSILLLFSSLFFSFLLSSSLFFFLLFSSFFFSFLLSSSVFFFLLLCSSFFSFLLSSSLFYFLLFFYILIPSFRNKSDLSISIWRQYNWHRPPEIDLPVSGLQVLYSDLLNVKKILSNENRNISCILEIDLSIEKIKDKLEKLEIINDEVSYQEFSDLLFYN